MSNATLKQASDTYEYLQDVNMDLHYANREKDLREIKSLTRCVIVERNKLSILENELSLLAGRDG